MKAIRLIVFAVISISIQTAYAGEDSQAFAENQIEKCDRSVVAKIDGLPFISSRQLENNKKNDNDIEKNFRPGGKVFRAIKGFLDANNTINCKLKDAGKSGVTFSKVSSIIKSRMDEQGATSWLPEFVVLQATLATRGLINFRISAGGDWSSEKYSIIDNAINAERVFYWERLQGRDFPIQLLSALVEYNEQLKEFDELLNKSTSDNSNSYTSANFVCNMSCRDATNSNFVEVTNVRIRSLRSKASQGDELNKACISISGQNPPRDGSLSDRIQVKGRLYVNNFLCNER